MSIEAIHHQMSLSRLGGSGDHGFEVLRVVHFGAAITHRAFDHAPGGHIKTGNQGLGAMTGIFKLVPFALSGSYGLVGRSLLRCWRVRSPCGQACANAAALSATM